MTYHVSFNIHFIKPNFSSINYLYTIWLKTLYIVRFLGVCNCCFYIANNNTIKVIDINYVLEEGGVTTLDPTPEQILTYQIGE